ncbi:secretin [Pseudomonas savastanoi pv. fraxini]|uniref:type II and III secretion system protein family protein n=1 Tax=Pseudomonas TaxID=286 RepID=UPI0004E0C909|nr:MULTISPECIES: type II and III secretion system protein family protein [Pseudomonas]KAA3537532.1 type II and III secretion system protein family protein [Pseudomonas savastanoi]KPB17242.1 Type II/IV secretion system secretin RcpA/CpaC [Pseudomonas savastanoi]KWS66757.1 secretin [Pseudomonas savastanoi pv. fraxini]PAB32404.1 secretin [Pseudomonas savastanoi pv. fraxini]TSC34937.1 type II and III secretion system protein family protein [Pseudomonas sp. ST1]
MSCCSVPVTKPRLLALAFAALSAQSAWAASGSCAGLAAMPAAVEIDQGIQQEVRSPVAITRIAVGAPKIADVHVNGTDGFLLTGVAQGTTSLMVWTACATAPRQSMVFVRGRATASMIESVTAPSADAELPSQVQTDIRFIEVSRTKLKEASTSIFGKGSNNFLFGAPGTVPGVNVTPGTVSGTRPSIPLNNSNFNIVWGGSSKVLAMLNAMENSGYAYTLARPSLVALNGQSASFLAGGEFPVPVPNGEGNGISIEYKEFGVRLTLTPTVVGRDRILLKVAPEVSELDFSAGITIAGTNVPALNIRRTDTSIALADGESFVVSGLISSSNVGSVGKFPGLGDIPILGAFFRNSQIQRDERELLMIVTPHLVQPLAANAQLPSLPGEGLRTYDPSFPRLYFLENGDFDRRDGLSK